MRTHGGTDLQITPEQVDEMRAWALDCQWEEDEEVIADLDDQDIIDGVQRHYAGGVAGFLADAI